MTEAQSQSIFQRYYGECGLEDRYDRDAAGAVDVVIPLLTVNEVFPANLCSYYREIPIRRLLIGDGGCSEATLAILGAFPRVEVIPQQENRTLGYCLRQLIERVETEWFVYLHADVYLPEGWFDAMARHQSEYDWFECHRRKTVQLDYPDVRQNRADRPYSGSQMGKKDAFLRFLERIEDDYLYRNEDLVLQDLVEQHGGRYGRVRDTFHYHQLMNRFGLEQPDLDEVNIVFARSDAWMKQTYDMQARGIVKYATPERAFMRQCLRGALQKMDRYGHLDKREFLQWTGRTNPQWLPFVRGVLRYRTGRVGRIGRELRIILQAMRRILRACV